MSSPNDFQRGPTALELAPSQTLAATYSIPRIIGLAGLGLATLGVAALIANSASAEQTAENLGSSDRLVSYNQGILAALLGFVMMIIHSLWDSDLEIRRVYGGVGAVLAAGGVVLLILPGKATQATESVVGYHFLPWGFFALSVGFCFLLAFVRNESDPAYANAGKMLLLGIGKALVVVTLFAGIFYPDQLIPKAPVACMLGLAYLYGYFSRTDVSQGLAYQLTLLLGVIGAAMLCYGLGRSIFPTVLYDGPTAIKTITQQTDTWKLIGRIFSISVGLGLASLYLVRSFVPVARIGFVVIGLLWAGLFLYGTFSAPLTQPPKPFLVPAGLTLIMLGAMTLLVSVALASDSQIVVLTRREFASYFYSPIGYIVLLGMVFVSWVGYGFFVTGIMQSSLQPGAEMREPIVADNVGAKILAAFQAMFLVPALTMRTFSEERRTGTLEVLLTAPVKEWTIVLSKFFAAWFYFLISWLPIGGFLIALWVAGGVPFDYRPMISYYAAVAVCGMAFVGMGIFFSSLTKNQIVAAVLTFAGMFVLFLAYLFKLAPTSTVGPGLKNAIARLDVLSFWGDALSGWVPLHAVVLQLSIAVLWLFATTKVLEIRKWG